MIILLILIIFLLIMCLLPLLLLFIVGVLEILREFFFQGAFSSLVCRVVEATVSMVTTASLYCKKKLNKPYQSDNIAIY